MNKSRNYDFAGIIFFFYIFLFVYSQVYAQSSDCPCPVGGKYKVNEILPDTISGSFSQSDFRMDIHNSCWDFGTKDQIPDNGRHPFDKYSFAVSIPGQYSFTGSDNNKLILAVYDPHFNSVPYCDNIIFGVGGYVDDGTLLYFEEPKNDGNIKNTITLDTGIVYGIAVVDYDTDFRGDYYFSINAVDSGEVFFSKAVYSEGCEFANCYEDTADYDIPVPAVFDGYDVSWTDDLRNGDYCGEQYLRRTYQGIDSTGNVINCESEYFFTGIDLLTYLQWPLNWDGLPGNNPKLGCSEAVKLDNAGNPHMDVTGRPEGFTSSCGTVEFFYNDNVYTVGKGVKILRSWVVVDDCSGKIYTHIQVILFKDNFVFEDIISDSLRFSTTALSCTADVEIPKLPLINDKCSTIKEYWVEVEADTIFGDDNGNGLYDSTETWTIRDLTIGNYGLCYSMIDSAGMQSEKCVNINIYDGKPPIPGCKMLEIDFPYCGLSSLAAPSFNGNSFDNCGDLFFKVFRANNGYGNDAECNFLKDTIRDEDFWYSDSVSVCFEDVLQSKIMVSLRVLDKDPGDGPVDPKRFEENGDLYNHYRDCWSVVSFADTLKPFIECHDAFVECDESIDPGQNPDLYPKIESGCLFDLEYFDTGRGNCSNQVLRTWKVKIDNVQSTCRQIITLSDIDTTFNPCSIVFPRDITVNCEGNIDSLPIWESHSCNDISAMIIKEDTFEFTEAGYYKIIREWAVIDHCVYESNSGAEDNRDVIVDNRLFCDSLVNDGFYRYTQEILVYNVLPDIIDCPEVQVTCHESLVPEENEKLRLNLISLCDYSYNEYTDKYFDEQCGQSIKRTWTISNGTDTSYCLQRIKILSGREFNPCSIVFPPKELSVLYNDLDNLQLPTWTNDHCNSVELVLAKEDTIVIQQDYKYKLIREWAIIDRCKYQPDTGAELNVDSVYNGKIDCSYLVNDGYYRYFQTVTVSKPSKITIVAPDRCLGTIDGCSYTDLELSAQLIDSCGAGNSTEWKYIVTKKYSGITIQYSYNVFPSPSQGIVGDTTRDVLRNSDVATIHLINPLSVGEYIVKWTARGHCGGVNTVMQYITIADKDAPVPAIVSQKEILLNDEIAVIRAVDFDSGDCEGCIDSYDNCTPKEMLYFTFTEHIPNLFDNGVEWANQYDKYGMYFFDPNSGVISTQELYLKGKADAYLPATGTSQRLLVKTSDELGYENIPDRIYVWDKLAYNEDCDDNNFAFSPVEINLIPEKIYNVSGNVTLLDGSTPFDGMKIVVKDTAFVESVSTVAGTYSFELKQGNYHISGSNVDDYFSGLSVRDILLIKLHLLGLATIREPYSIVAMDVNNDKKVTASDILSILKILVRKTNGFDNSPWLALSKDYDFANSSKPLDEIEYAKVRNVEVGDNDIQNQDFYAVKIGDIDHSLFESLPQDSTGLNFFVKNKKFAKGEIVEVPVYAKNFNQVYGFQMVLNIKGMDFDDIKSGAILIDDRYYNYVAGSLFITYDIFSGDNIDENQVLFTLRLKANVDSDLYNVLGLGDLLLSPEAYITEDLDVSKLSFDVRKYIGIDEQEKIAGYNLWQNYPNPFSGTTNIEFSVPNSSDFKLSIFDITGKEIKSYSGKSKKGMNRVTVSKKDLSTQGVLFYRLATNGFVSTKRMVIF